MSSRCRWFQVGAFPLSTSCPFHNSSHIETFCQSIDSTGEAVVCLTKDKDHSCLHKVLSSASVFNLSGTLLQKINEAILHASHVGDAHSLKELLSAGGDAGCEDSYSNTALILAAQHGDTERQASVTKLLTEAGADPDKVDMGGRSALHWACLSGHTSVVKQLVSAGATLDLIDSTLGYTPLMLAARHGHSEILQFLIHHNVSVNTPDMFGETALFDAIRQNHLKCVELLLEAGARTDIVDKRSRTPLLTAVLWNDNPDVVIRLVRENLPINKPGLMFNRTTTLESEKTMTNPLEAAISREKVAMTKILYISGAMVNTKCLQKLEEWENTAAKESLFKLLKAPRSLRHMCRCSIRSRLGTPLTKQLVELPLPQPLKDYLCIPELWQYEGLEN